MSERGGRYRTVDLARLAGVSAQQVRNYADAGVLPAVSRSEAGYRRFGEIHRRALSTYRALLKGYGHTTAHAVLRAVHTGDVSGALALVDAAHAELHEQRRALRDAGEALDAMVGGAQQDLPGRRSPMRIGEVAASLGVRPSALRVWEEAGLLAPSRERATGYRRFGPADLRDARMIHLLRQNHYPLPRIREVLDAVRREGSSQEVRVAIAERQARLTERTRKMLRAAGQLHHYLENRPFGVEEHVEDITGHP
ncbi:MerR family transcriptional regulator [Actinopolyspora erythraea]|uniref:MerR family transcriptional regulator n=1 Tax=Actinopolyspora erythraea TaxID=414996 RepID=A0A223RS03_9ACTN|nr:TioE family transcriptional regulator [Actinopolyspora erythraea]ASU78620.1 MerR family transcriptional regulator [Actinopolyspora erythraea]